jgi:hypothetical protein
MVACRILLASVLLSSSPDSQPPDAPHVCHAELAPSVRRLALEWQIVDARELDRILVDAQDFQKDLRVLQERRLRLHNAPLLEERERFPPLKLVEQLISHNRAYRRELEDRLAIDPLHAEELRAAIDEVEHLFRIWETLRDALTEHYYVDFQRQALDRLRDQLGMTAFYRGDMPPALPIWRLPRN